MTTPFPVESEQNCDLSRVTKADVHFRLLTIRDAEREYGLSGKRIYAAVRAGRVHPVKPNGRTLYPEWELAALLRSLFGALAA